ncbi:hypothetical protein M4D70_17285 [Brevibacillus borstelensis]|uniref:hypothetical protein n=1 Tax=Brevibacillus borstelensis TaxID=45462 RepID=UPI00203A9856|nr:hypothetical protein [Brevibacillus borstelensis]MCM3623983.1 hypothetical protein [Brevibacillus borstelensis]
MNNNTKRKKAEIKKAIDFFEELIWLFDSKKIPKLKEIPMSLRTLLETSDSEIVSGKYKSSNPNIHFLIGVLPRLFKDEGLFPNNNSIAHFAEEILHINVTRADKRSRYELIGLIVCETDNLSDGQLIDLVNALSKITGNDDNLKKLKENKYGDNFSWNEAIKKLTEINNE